MQTFLPSRSFVKSAQILDYKRLGKQRLEGLQLWNIVSGKRTEGGWIHHPACLMWLSYPDALAHYTNCMINEWISRGYNNTMKHIPFIGKKMEYPSWLGNNKFHSSHRAKLLGKNFEYYSKFNWKEEPQSAEVPYYWPVTKDK